MILTTIHTAIVGWYRNVHIPFSTCALAYWGQGIQGKPFGLHYSVLLIHARGHKLLDEMFALSLGSHIMGKCRRQPWFWNYTNSDQIHRRIRVLDAELCGLSSFLIELADASYGRCCGRSDMHIRFVHLSTTRNVSFILLTLTGFSRGSCTARRY